MAVINNLAGFISLSNSETAVVFTDWDEVLMEKQLGQCRKHSVMSIIH